VNDQRPEPLPFVLTVAECAAALRISRSAAYRLIPRRGQSAGPGQLPAVWLGRKVRIPRDALMRMLDGAQPGEAS
jgi:excisionase family DNA binding protein